MTRMLLTRAAFDRVQPQLGALQDRLEWILMERHGSLDYRGRTVAPRDAGAECAWVSHDLFTDGLVPRFSDVLREQDGLAWVQSAGAGFDHPMFAMLAGMGVRLTTNHGQAVGMAEYVLWGVLDHFQGGRMLEDAQAQRRWTKWRSREISGSRWLVIGFGAIGEAVARRAKAFDAHVTGVRRRPQPSPFADAMVTPDRLFDCLGESDVVVLCVPHSRDTADMVDAKFLAAMKPGSVFVNVGRGSLVDEAALLEALDSGTPEHAVLDVFRQEPLPPDSRFWDHPRVTVTAHTSALSSGLEARSDRIFLDNLARYLAGEPLLNEVPASEVLASAAG